MKKLLIIFLTLFISIGVFAQPSRMSFQAVVRNTSGQLVSNSTVGIRLQILKGSEFGSAVFVENHFISTNANGLASFEIGGGSNVFGSIATIDWASGPYFLKTETDPNGGSNYSITGTSQMLSVPYALFSGSGVKGDKGDQGEPGQQGIKGDKGDQGLLGIKGDKGDQGEPGQQGIKGDKGDQGLSGIKGDKGDQGEPGQQGIKGDKGDQGLSGIKGDKGDQGEPGQQGIKGDKGDKGDDGKPGSANIYGNTGYLIKFNGSTSGDNSIIQQENSVININSPSRTDGKLNVKGVSGGFGIHGESDYIGVQGEGAIGVYGKGIDGGVGVSGYSKSNDGVKGKSDAKGNGVIGDSYSGNGVRGISYSGAGLRGSSISSFGVHGFSGSGIAGSFESELNTGIFVTSSYGAGVVINVSASRTAIQAVQGNVFFGTGYVGIGTTAFNYKLQLGTNSAAKPTSNTWTVPSDERLKKDIASYKGGLTEVLKINPVWFTYNGQGGMPNETGVGVLAQELQIIAPYMVNKWLYKKDEHDPGTEYLGVDNGSMTYMLINAVKEQQQMIESLSKQIEAKNKMFESFQTKLDELYKEKLASDGH